MARTADSRSSLVELKAVDADYPLFGEVTTDPALPLTNLFAQDGGTFGAVVDPTLLTRLDLKTGDRITIGKATLELRAALTARTRQALRWSRARTARAGERSGAARHRPVAARQPGALAIPAAITCRRRKRQRCHLAAEASRGGVSGGGLGSPQPQ